MSESDADFHGMPRRRGEVDNTPAEWCGRRDTQHLLLPLSERPICTLPPKHDGPCNWDPAYEAFQASQTTVKTDGYNTTWSVTLHPTNRRLVGCGLSLHQCPVCCALVVEDYMEEHKLWHLRHV